MEEVKPDVRALAFARQALKNLFMKPATTSYPFEPASYPERMRGHVELVAEDCIGCGLCMRSCPPGAPNTSHSPMVPVSGSQARNTRARRLSRTVITQARTTNRTASNAKKYRIQSANRSYTVASIGIDRI